MQAECMAMQWRVQMCRGGLQNFEVQFFDFQPGQLHRLLELNGTLDSCKASVVLTTLYLF